MAATMWLFLDARDEQALGVPRLNRLDPYKAEASAAMEHHKRRYGSNIQRTLLEGATFSRPTSNF